MEDLERTRREERDFKRALFGVGQVDSERIAAALARVEKNVLGESTTAAPSYDRFVILRELGVGGCGRVYLAYDPELDRKVALKQLLRRRHVADNTAADEREAMLLREAQTLAKLRHPHVVSVYDIKEMTSSTGRKSLSIVMEFVEGVTLRQWLKTEERPLAEILRVFVEAGRGLAAAHEAGIIHRDFKPDNVLIDGEGRARVLDFGLSETAGGNSTSASDSEAGGFTGTPAYMAPEQFANRPGDARSDVFSFAVTLWEALVGGRPFPGANIAQVRRRICDGDIAEPAQESRMPRRYDRILRQALAIDPDTRTPSMAALLGELQHDPWERPKRVAQLLGVLLVLAAIAAIVYLLTRPGTIEVDAEGPGGGLRPSAVWVGETPLEIGSDRARGDVSPGVYRLRVEAPGMLPDEEIITVERGALQRRTVLLQPTTGELNVELSPVGATVLVDGVEYGSRIVHQPLVNGAHHLRARLLGHYEQRRELTVREGESVDHYISLAPAEVWSRRHTGIRHSAHWIGDITGDGLPELSHKTYTLITVSDPWTDRDLWVKDLPTGANQDELWVDSDGDERGELVTLESLDNILELSLWRPPADGQAARRLWRVRADVSTVPAELRAKGQTRRALAVDTDDSGAEDTLVLPDLPDGTTLAINLRDGSERWRVRGERIAGQRIAGRADSGRSIFQREGQHLRALDAATGATLWSAAADEHGAGALYPAELNGDHTEDVIAGVRTNDLRSVDSYIIAYDGATGRELWRRAARGLAILDGDAARGELALIAITQDLSDDESSVSLLDGDGSSRWTAPAPIEAKVTWWPAEGDTPAYVELLHASGLEFRRVADGSLVDQIATAAAPVTSPAHVDWDSDGKLDVLVGCADRTLVGFRPGLGWTGSITFDSVVESIEPSGDLDLDGYPDLLVRAYGPKVISGRKSRWRRNSADAIRATPIVTDVDGDGDLELVAFGAFSGRNSLHFFDAATGVLEQVGDFNTEMNLRGAATLPREDGGVDLFVTTAQRVIRFSGRDASVMEIVTVPETYSKPALIDLDGDGTPEVVTTPWSTQSPIEVRAADDLRLLWSLDLDGPGDGSWCEARAYEVAGSPAPVLVVGLHRGDLVALDSRSGEERWRVALELRQVYPPTIVDLDGDGEVELLASAEGHRRGTADLIAISGDDGRELHRWPRMGSTLGGVLVTSAGDLGPEGERLLIVATEDRGIVGFTVDGVERWRYRLHADVDQPRASAPLQLANFGDDRLLTVLAAMRDGTLYALNAGTGELLWRYSTEEPNIEATPVAADVDGDGYPEVVVAGHDRQLAVLRTPRRRAAQPAR